MSTELALAQDTSVSEPQNPQQRKETLAVLEGHDADLPTEDQAFKPAYDSSSPKPAVSPISSNNALTHHVQSPATAHKETPAGEEENDELPNEKDIETSGLEKDIDLENGRCSDSTADKKDADAQEQSAEPVDPNVVDWDGPNDPYNPINWTSRKKWSNIGIMAAITFLTPLASTMLAPAIPDVQAEFHNNNEELASFAVSVYILGFAFGPLIIAPLSELYGRLPVYQGGNVGFLIFTIACALSSNFNMLIGWRFIQGLFGSVPLTIGGGTIADMIVQEKRGGVMAIWALGPLLGPVIGPVCGGFLSQAKGWRWVLWIVAIAAGVICVAALLFLRETYPVTLLERKASRLRAETGNSQLHSKLASKLSTKALFKRSVIRPTRMLIFSPIVLALSTYMAVVYGYLYLLFTTLTEVFEGDYKFSPGSVGLTYLGIGIGCLLGVGIFGFASDKILKHMSAKGAMKPEYRLPPMIPGSFCVPFGLFLYGWTVERHVHWIVPIIGTSFVGIGLLATFMPIQTYLVDAFGIYAASAIAASTVLRSLIGALLPLAGRKMYQTLGLGWGNSLLAFIALAMCPIPWVFFRYGERIRTSKRFEIKF